MSECTARQLRFPPVEGLTVRADFQGGTLSSDFGVMLLRGIDQQIGCGYADGNDANSLRREPLFKLGLDRKPLDPDTDLASFGYQLKPGQFSDELKFLAPVSDSG